MGSGDHISNSIIHITVNRQLSVYDTDRVRKEAKARVVGHES